MCIYVRIFPGTYIDIDIYVCIYTHVCIYVYICRIYMYTCTYTCTHVYIYMYTYMQICLFVRVKDPHANPCMKRFDSEALLSRSVCIYIHMHTYVYLKVFVYICVSAKDPHTHWKVSHFKERLSSLTQECLTLSFKGERSYK